MKKIITILCAATVLLASCKKSAEMPPAPEKTIQQKKIAATSYVWDNNAPETEQIVYDQQDRVTQYTDNNYVETFDYQTPEFLLVTRRKRSNNSLDRTIECTLNNKGAIVKMLFKDVTGKITYMYEYLYNTDGYVVTKKGSNTGSNYQVDYEIQNGNVVSSKIYFNGVHTYNSVFSITTLLNPVNRGVDAYWPVPRLFGTAAKKLIGETKQYKVATGELNNHTRNTWLLDNEGYITRYIDENLVDGKTGVTDYTLQ